MPDMIKKSCPAFSEKSGIFRKNRTFAGQLLSVVFMKNILLLFILLFPCFVVAQENPFIQMAGKKYAEYSQEMLEEYKAFMKLDSVEAQKVIHQIENVAEKTGSVEWKLRADYFKLELFGRNQNLFENNPYYAEELLKDAFRLLKEMEKANVPQLELMLRQKIIDYYWIYFKNYEAAFELYSIQNKRLENISSDDVPEKALYYVHLADAHYFFKNYSNAISYYDKILEEKETSSSQASQQHARNGLALCYKSAYNDLDKSASYSTAIIQVNYLGSNEEYFRKVWNGIAEGNLGNNMFLCGEYDKAIPLLESSIEKMLEYDDYAYASGPAIDLADLYLRKNNIAEAKKYVDLAREYYNKMPREGRLERIYEIMSKYYASVGNPKLSMAYIDSMLKENKRHQEQFNAMVLLRMEQKESAKQQQELFREKEMKKQIQIRLMIISGGFIVISILSVLLFFLYRRKRHAYRELVRKSQEWAQVQPVIIDDEHIITQNDSNKQPEKEQKSHNTPPDEIDFSIMKNIERLMQEEKIFQDNTLSVDSLTQMLGTKKHYVSGAINRCTKNNFSNFVNEYRIKEAIRFMSDEKSYIYSIDGIAFDLGFNDRKSFHRVFKKITGLSPTEFRKNVSG
jgi:AraC-like DNA-binding protein